ncbi:MAG TPA: HAD family phosphatase [Phycisphaerales bacterium]|nr:HAD family phosphatase [Phycisphaerales bacterium]
MDGLVFDFDGVVVDSEPLHEAALLGAVRALGMDFSHQRYVEEYIGYDDRDVLRAVSRDCGITVSTADAERFHDLKKHAFLEVIEQGGVKPFPGSVELIKAAADRLPIAVCSGARLHEILPILDRLGVQRLFKTIVAADDVERSKPDPAPYLLTARRLGLSPARLVAIEDTPTGVESAISAGYRVAGVAHSVGVEQLGRATRAFRTIADLSLEILMAL